MLGKKPLQKERVYLNAELMDLLDFTASIFGVSSSEILRFSLRNKDDRSFKKQKRTQGIFFKQKCTKAGKDNSKKEAFSNYCLPYFANVECLANRSEAESFCVVETTTTTSKRQAKKTKKDKQ